MHNLKNLKPVTYAVITFVMLVLLAVVLYLMGQVLICECGYVKFWHGVPVSSENSQHISDWYSFSHVIHGFIFFWILSWLFPQWPLGLRLVAALMPEIAWEMFENTDFVIEYYRENTVSLDYYGDSVINSVSDVLYMVLGFFLAAWLPVWAVILLIVGMEGLTLYFIRDNLFLNILMFVYPFDGIKEWQSMR